jgi:small-conductance mechanosensitive channel
MEGFLKLGFFSMADKITETLKGSFAYILTGAVIIAIWIYFLFLVPRKQKRYDKVSDYLQDVLNFGVMLGSGLAKILYIAFAIVLVVVGIVAMFVTNFFIGLLGTIILQIILRVLFEIFMVIFSIQENVIAIREKLEKAEEDYYYED